MKKEGFGGMFNSKYAKVNVVLMLLFAVIFVLSMVYVFATDIALPSSSAGLRNKPLNKEINTTSSRNINFTFNVTWSLNGEVVTNCSLWTNFTGSWVNTTYNVSSNSNISNLSVSWINYTFTHDIGLIVWNIGCFNVTSAAAALIFNQTNYTLSIDTLIPKVIQTADIFQGFNTSSATPTITFNITDINGTGINLTTNGNNATLNVTLLDLNSGTDATLAIYNISNSSLSCGTEDATTSTQCTLSLSTMSLTNGTKNLTVSVSDRAGFVNITSFTFVVDNIAPRNHPMLTGEILLYNITHSPLANLSQGSAGDNNNMSLNTSNFGGTAQARTIFAKSNWTDNLTRPRAAVLQWYNDSSSTWMTVNATTDYSPSFRLFENNSWSNLSFRIPSGHNEFEGKNVSFRLVANDTVGNINSSSTAFNITITVNDTTQPTISIPNGTVQVNGSNITDTTPTISWLIKENNPLTIINVSIDKNTHAGSGVDSNCGLSAIYITATAGLNNVERNRNGTFTVVSDPSCTLTNGTHFVNITATDSWGNTVAFGHSFSVLSGIIPALNFSNVTGGSGSLTVTTAAVNNTNLTSSTARGNSMGLGFYGTALAGVNVANLTYVSSCNSSSTVTFSNNTVVFPFNESTCPTTSGNRSLVVTVTDTAGNSNATTFGFLVDNVAPSLAVWSPTNGQYFTNTNVSFNFSAKDDDSSIAFVGYYLDESPFAIAFNTSTTGGTAGQGVNHSDSRLLNFTPGTHTVKLTANDSLGNAVNGSLLTFTITGPLNFSNYLNASIGTANFLNVSVIYLFNSSGSTIANTTGTSAGSAMFNTRDETWSLLMKLNGSAGTSNVTIAFNASSANWAKNFSISVNDSKLKNQINSNFSADVQELISFNNSIQEFLANNNSYYGVVTYKVNASNATNSAPIGGSLEVWYFPDLDDVTSKTNLTECAAGFNPSFTFTTSSACWNNTDNISIKIYVPHFSGVGVVNNSGNPTVNVTAPASANQSVASFIPNITVSSDTASCVYSINSSVANKTMVLSGTTCLGALENFKNHNADPAGPGGYNFTFTATDTDGNVNTYFWRFNVTDNTAPNNGPVTDSASTTSATVTITGTNESVNATVNYGTSNTSLSSSATETDFNETQAVTLSSLSASTTYYYNVTVCDYAGNCKTNTTVFSFTTSAASSSSSSSSSSSGGGGGGGAAVSNVLAIAGRQWDSLASGSTAALTINNAQIAVTGIVVDVSNAVTNADLTVESLNSNPYTTPAADKIYQYLNLKKSNIGDSDASKITITFRVPKSWLASNGVSEDDMALYRYSNGQWGQLSTMKTGSDSDYVTYQSTTPGFSVFAVGIKGGAAPVEAQPTPEEAGQPEAPGETGTTSAQPEAPSTPVAPTAPVEQKGGLSSSAKGWILVAVIVLVAGIGYFMWQRRK